MQEIIDIGEATQAMRDLALMAGALLNSPEHVEADLAAHVGKRVVAAVEHFDQGIAQAARIAASRGGKPLLRLVVEG